MNFVCQMSSTITFISSNRIHFIGTEELLPENMKHRNHSLGFDPLSPFFSLYACRIFYSKKLKNVSFYICCSLIWFERLKRQKNGETGFRTLSPHNFYHISTTKKDLAKPYETSSFYTAIHTFPSIMRVLCLKILNSNHCFFSLKKTNVQYTEIVFNAF